MLIALLIIAGLCAGSFVSALTWRIKEGKDWVNGRSECPSCGHQLNALDLVPILSWLALRGKCRYCGKKISIEYPIIELIAAVTFAGSYIFWPASLSQPGQELLLTAWLISWVGLLAIAVYDFRWKLMPNIILLPTAVVAIAARLAYIVRYSDHAGHDLWQSILAIAVASGIFGLIYLISAGKWIGSGDISLGVITGSLLGRPSLAILMIFLASLIGSIVNIPMLASAKKNLQRQIPYGPYLIAATAVSLIFGSSIISWYQHFYK